jgi:hypothetical protein
VEAVAVEVFVTRRIDYRRARILLREAVVDSIRRRRLPYPAVVVVVERRPGLVVFAGSIAGKVADTRRVVAVASLRLLVVASAKTA